MKITLKSRVRSAWNAFKSRDPTEQHITNFGEATWYRPDRPRLSRGNDRSIATSVFNRIAMDVSMIDIIHCDLDEDGRFESERNSGLNNCLRLESNIDQTGQDFIQDVVMSMFDEGAVAIVPIDTSADPRITDSYDIYSWRTGKILEWFPQHVKVRVYNDKTGKREDLILPKRMVSIIPNPLYAVMNEPNSTLARLKRKLSLLDVTDEQTASGKLDLIIQLPYAVKSDLQTQRAEKHMQSIEKQLSSSRYGVAYADATEKIVQLNRPVENNLMKHIEYLTDMFYSQLGMSPAVFNGTASEQEMLNYYSRTIKPIVSAIVDGIKRTFLSKTARSQRQSIVFFRDPFELVPINNIADIADKFTRNEILSSNEMRQVIGRKPSKDPKADQLVNSNISQPAEEPKDKITPEENKEGGEIQNGV